LLRLLLLRRFVVEEALAEATDHILNEDGARDGAGLQAR
jgi:hypothetical protein